MANSFEDALRRVLANLEKAQVAVTTSEVFQAHALSLAATTQASAGDQVARKYLDFAQIEIPVIQKDCKAALESTIRAIGLINGYLNEITGGGDS